MLKNTYSILLITRFIFELSTSQSKEVITDLQEVDNFVIDMLNNEWKNIPREDPDVEMPTEVVRKATIFLASLLRNYAICGLFFGVKTSYCRLAVDVGEQLNTNEYSTITSICHPQKINFRLEHVGINDNPMVWMFVCPKIANNETKKYFLGIVDGSINKMIVYAQDGVMAKIKPIRVVLDITLGDLLGISSPKTTNNPQSTTTESYNHILQLKTSPLPIIEAV